VTAWRALLAAMVLAAEGCATAPPGAEAPPPAERLFDGETAIAEAWLHYPLNRATDYSLAHFDGLPAIRAKGRESASLLIRRVKIDWRTCPEFEWTWAARHVQAKADIRVWGEEDVAASIYLLFGDPGLLAAPNPVPTLRYVWTNHRLPAETVVDNPYLPGTVRSIVIESGDARTGRWLRFKRNLADDFERAFGEPPEHPIQAIALFTDNDQTKEPVDTYYGWARAVCAAAEKPVG